MGESELPYQLAFEQALTAMALLDVAPDGVFRCREVNRALEAFLGCGDLAGVDFAELAPAEDALVVRAAFGELANGRRTSYEAEHRFRHAGGGMVWAMLRAALVLDSEGQPMYALSQLEDITARKAAEERLHTLADEQAALRRVATLLARGVAPAEVFDAVTVETTQVLSADASGLFRFEPDGGMTVMAQDHRKPGGMKVGGRMALDGDSAAARVLRTGRPARMESYEHAGTIAEAQRKAGYRAAIGAPVVVEGALWGVMITTWGGTRPMPPGSEDRLAEFTALIATAVANAESRAELTASRARIVRAGDEARRRIQRNIHDGAQQRLVSLALDVRVAQDMSGPGQPELTAELERIANTVAEAADELQEIARGLHPAVLSRGGLQVALQALSRRCLTPVRVSVDLPGRLPEPLEVAAYYIVSEALTNAAKHAAASIIDVIVATDDDELTLTVRDDGRGGADPTLGSGLVGLRDRVEALGGTLSIASPPGQGTRLDMRLPMSERPRDVLVSRPLDATRR